MTSSLSSLRAAVIGGSVSGLAAAIALRRAGLDVVVHERSTSHREKRGAGIVMQPALAGFIASHDLGDPRAVSVPASHELDLDRNGRETSRLLPRRMTSWDTLLRLFLGALPSGTVRLGSRLTSLDARSPRPRIGLDGSPPLEAYDLVVLADGGNSTGRRLLVPDCVPRYAGYVAWRGVVDERDLAPDLARAFQDRFVRFLEPGVQVLAYYIPGEDGSTRPGGLRLNWVWYANVPEEGLAEHLTDVDGSVREWSVPPGFVATALWARQCEQARRSLPEAFTRLVCATARPFLQPIRDLAVPSMVRGRVVIVGDAAFTARPHVACNAAKGCANAGALGASLLGHPSDPDAALRAWEPSQLDLGRTVCEEGIAMGTQSQFPS